MQHRIKPRKKLGQHFLKDLFFARKIIESMGIQKDDHILEIGPGQGELTELLLESPAERIVAVEIDPECVQLLRNRFGEEKRFHLIQADILNVDLGQWMERDNKIRIVGNLPYNITSPILFRLLGLRSSIRDMTIMVQKEVGERLTSPPGIKAYGIPSVLFQVYSRIKTLFFVPRTAFYPIPKVDSSVLTFQFFDPVPFDIKNAELFERVVKTTFGQRRKMLKNTLKQIVTDENRLNELSVDLKKRPESLSVDQFVQLTNELHNN